jgi:hypothetical protein
MDNKVVINRIEEIDSLIGDALENVLSLMKIRAEKILESHQENIPTEIYEDLQKDQDKRYAEIKDWLAKEYFLRFNDELFVSNIVSVPVIPTKTNSHVDKDVISDNRKNFSKYFFEGRMNE